MPTSSMLTNWEPACSPGRDTLHFGFGHSWLGWFLVAGGPGRVRAILLGDRPDALVAALRARAPEASLTRADAPLAPLIARVGHLLEFPGENVDIPLDLRGDDLQRRVWQALRGIPAGGTASYSEIARRVGSAATAQDVAAACAANPVAVAVPCHRVVRSDGSIAGYRWGVGRKRALLAREARS
ncbi:MAG: methylated-DNA--[protein]-cysteine S-methyltransferase [Gemmatimonadales bacterium]